MAKRRRSSLGVRLILVLAIPIIYTFVAGIAGYFTAGGNSGIPGSSSQFSVSSAEKSSYSSRRLLQLTNQTNGLTPVLENVIIANGNNISADCTPPSIDEFPSDGLTREQRQKGLLVVHIIIAIYCFFLLAVVCDDFFVPSITRICEKIGMSEDVAGATFMAAASSSPELFINIIGTFVTEGDLGVGTIVGSAVFNILAVPACCGLFASQVLDLDWWPISRDSMAYGITVLLLIVTLRDGRIEWYEAFVLVLFYIFYILAMCFNTRLNGCLDIFVTKRRRKYRNLSETSPLVVKDKFHNSFVQSSSEKTTGHQNGNFFTNTKANEALYQAGDCNGNAMDIESLEFGDDVSDIVSMTNWPDDAWERCWWVITWPINACLLITIPDCRRKSLSNWYPLTFGMCIVWIAAVSYVVGWDITIIGDTLMIPDSVMGLTFLAAGMSVPEAVSSVIVTNQGHGTMGISNSIGSNVFDVLLCLGLPWFVKSVFFPVTSGQHYVQINSEGLIYSSVSLMSTLFLLYVALAANKFKLDRKIGIICLTMYSVFLVFASLVELNVFFVVNQPTCPH